MARPTQQRTRFVKIRLTEREFEFVQHQSEGASLTLSEYIRRRMLGKRVVSRTDIRLQNEVRRLGGLQKHLAAIYPEQKVEFGRVLNEIILWLRRHP